MYSEITNVHNIPQQTAFAKCIMTYILIINGVRGWRGSQGANQFYFTA